MYLPEKQVIWVAKGENPVYLLPGMANRHGLITGATGTGKTVTLKVLAESFSDMGVPVFLADIKGDVSGLLKPGEPNSNVEDRVKSLGVEGFTYGSYPVRFFDIYGKRGIPVRATVSDMGPWLLARILGLNDTQANVLALVFRIADDNGLLLIDLKDLHAMLMFAAEHRKEYQMTYGNISPQTVGAIQRAVLNLQDQGGLNFFGEPDLQLNDWIATDEQGRGYINLLHCVELIHSPLIYSTFLLWMLTELYELLPETGDTDVPRIVFFFDEAHMLFTDAPKALVQKIEQIARLIRSKGVGVYFVTQSPSDIPDTVLAQLGNKVQHALRAYTAKEQRAIRAAAMSFRPNPSFNTEDAISSLGTGEALLSMLDEDGIPGIVERGFVLPPRSFFGVAEDELVQGVVQNSPLYTKYGTQIDRQSAYEDITSDQQKAQEEEEARLLEIEEKKQALLDEKEQAKLEKERQKEALRLEREKAKPTIVTKMVNSAATSIGRQLGSSLLRGIFGTLKR